MDTKEQTPTPKEPQRALITYRTKELKEGAKWSEWREREIDSALDSYEAMERFYSRRTWPTMTGSIEVKGITWLGEVL